VLVPVTRVDHSRSLVQAQTLLILSTIKNLVKIVKYLEFLAKVYSNITGNAVHSC